MSTNTEEWEGEGGAVLTAPGSHTTSRMHFAAEAIGAESILIEEGTHLPNSIPLRPGYLDGWLAVTGERAAFEKEVEKAGWTFFFMAGEIKATVFDFDRHKALRAALTRLIANVKSQNCNSIQITRVTGKSLLKVPYLSVYAHPRHLQKGPFFSGRR